jgi:peptidoglycan/LPS O-acetylase OafA/YrhL
VPLPSIAEKNKKWPNWISEVPEAWRPCQLQAPFIHRPEYFPYGPGRIACLSVNDTPMPITSPLPYFVLAPCLIGVAGILAHFIPQSRDKLHVPLESLRGLLAMSVLFSHAVVSYFYFQTGVWTSPATPFYAFLGPGPVTLFFFLSGFLFWSKCLAHDGIKGYGNFLAGRVRRLVPAYYVSVAIVMFLVLARMHFKLTVPFSTFLSELARWLIFVPTRGVNGFPHASLINASVVWTLMFEMIFYLLLPLIFFLFKGYRIIIYMAITGVVSWMLARHGFTAFSPAVVRAGTLPFVAFALNSVFGFGFGIGMLVAVLYARCPKTWWDVLKRRLLTPIPLFCLSAPILLKLGSYSPGQFLLLGVVFVFVVAGNDFFGLLSSKAVFLLGTVSYSFYITHGIVLFVLSHLFNQWVQIRTLSPLQYWSLIGVVGVITVCFSTLLYWTVERRFMRHSSALSLVAASDPNASLNLSPGLMATRGYRAVN